LNVWTLKNVMLKGSTVGKVGKVDFKGEAPCAVTEAMRQIKTLAESAPGRHSNLKNRTDEHRLMSTCLRPARASRL
jgi:hypothetical protein